MSQTVEILDRLIGFDTVSAKSNLPLIDYVEAFLKSRGFRITRLPDPTGEKAGLFATIGPEGAGVMLSAHTDVVPVEGQNWSRDPFALTRAGSRLYGRGATDMKGFLASMLTAADRASSRNLAEPLKLSISYDEEVGCLGVAEMIGAMEAAVGRPRACIVGEPTEMQVAVGHKGKAALKATFSGEAGHSALAPRFTNALDLAADFVAGLRELQQKIAATGKRDQAYAIPYTTLHIGKLSGGTALNIVPDHAKAIFEYRHLAEDSPEMIEAEINRIAGAISSAHPNGGVKIERVNAYPGLATGRAESVVTLAKTLAQTNDTTKVAFGTEAGYFSAAGVPTIVCGPGSMEGQGHKADEYVEESQLAACDQMMDRLLDTLTR